MSSTYTRLFNKNAQIVTKHENIRNAIIKKT